MAIFGKPRKPTLDWTDAGAIKKELTRTRELVPAAEQAVAEAQAALDAHLARRETIGVAVSLARQAAWSSGRDDLIVRDPLDPGAFINLGADADDEAKAVLAQREWLWAEAEQEEARVRVALTLANERRGALKGQVRSFQDRHDQLKAGPAPRPDPNRLPGGGVAGLLAAGGARR